MNEIFANIYGTGGMEKVASADMPSTLTELAEMIAQQDSNGDLEKVASATNEILETLVAYDQAGRAIAQQEFADMEKMAMEGDTSALEAFFADEDQVESEEADMSNDELKEAIIAELRRRHS